MITWTPVCRNEIKSQILPYNYMGKLDSIPARRDKCPPGFYLDLYTFFLISLGNDVSLRKLIDSEAFRFRSRHQRRFPYIKLIFKISQYSQKTPILEWFIKKGCNASLPVDVVKVLRTPSRTFLNRYELTMVMSKIFYRISNNLCRNNIERKMWIFLLYLLLLITS